MFSKRPSKILEELFPDLADLVDKWSVTELLRGGYRVCHGVPSSHHTHTHMCARTLSVSLHLSVSKYQDTYSHSHCELTPENSQLSSREFPHLKGTTSLSTPSLVAPTYGQELPCQLSSTKLLQLAQDQKYKISDALASVQSNSARPYQV